jgi:hypothetical protein
VPNLLQNLTLSLDFGLSSPKAQCATAESDSHAVHHAEHPSAVVIGLSLDLVFARLLGFPLRFGLAVQSAADCEPAQ